MKILFCIDSLTKGGAERVVSNISNYLDGKGYDIEIVTFASICSQYELSKNVHHKIIGVSGNRISRLRNRVKKLKEEINTFKPDVILAFLPYASLVALLANKSLRKKIIVSVRNDPTIEYKTIKYKYLKNFLYPKVDGFVMQTEDMKRYFSENIQKKSVVIPNPINESFIEKVYTGERTREVVTVGRLFEQKNHKLLIDAFAELPSCFSDYKLIIYGEGPLRRGLEEYIDHVGLSGRVFLPGKVDDVSSKIRKAACFAMSSNYEGMPNALMEAMALGLPVISTDCPCGGPKFLIKNGENGILVNMKDVSAMKDAMRRILEDEVLARKLGENARLISRTLNPNDINKQWEKFIRKVADSEN